MANEVVDSRRKQGVSSVLCKFDLEKAYDHMNLRFLDFSMLKIKFGEKWRKLIYFSISSVRFSVAVNGFCGSSRSLRQEDPLPLMFILVMGTLSRMMDRVALGGYLKDFNVVLGGLGTVLVSHYLFAGDPLVFMM